MFMLFAPSSFTGAKNVWSWCGYWPKIGIHGLAELFGISCVQISLISFLGQTALLLFECYMCWVFRHVVEFEYCESLSYLNMCLSLRYARGVFLFRVCSLTVQKCD